MAEERPEDTAPSPDSARPKRAPPTIELGATEVSSEAPKTEQPEASADTAAPEAPSQPEPHPETASEAPASEPPQPVSPWVVAPVSGAVAAALVIGVGWLLGWPQIQPASQLNTAAIDDLSARVAGLESKVNRAPAADPRLEALDKSIAALRSELAATRAQSDKLAATATGAKALPDLSAITARIDRIEGAVKSQNAEIAKQDSKIADTRAEAKPADDTPLRRVVAASLLDVAVRHGDPFVSSLSAAKALADDPEILKPLDAFAASGVPNANALCRELIEIVPKLAPPPQDTTTGAGLVDRLQAGASKLIRIERTDGTGTDRGSIVARMTSAAVHNDLARAERELRSLPPADRTAAQAWIERVDARRAALDASRKFADNAMAALASVNQ
ncbi:hypothetical protein MTX26_01345 [Bradyrhizobium sp. ISRA443]|uniref:COG4223 family protein n=1 Tax=unclassified Bradyrhizobium TaxID=2631580 RepID=UPI00247B0F1C|nr:MULTISPECIES: hypothetical protein [unclassified Bradyrhizobium]WGR94727.1 hypothetical protein MTX20_11365 [Bradyrhizobium sp. ISRA435]WGR99548.1 hypothetical protein MTX23_01345 [Bradyrhizobium sp. ISRA436]WGS06438.1 hypothetical protein MTX18_01345 [Bradyrhizobium sp. ISRA437]WGS13322.1 hypothetical protein MTX26_01345 [Bradyrhizobium sp. ISRA443]